MLILVELPILINRGEIVQHEVKIPDLVQAAPRPDRLPLSDDLDFLFQRVAAVGIDAPLYLARIALELRPFGYVTGGSNMIPRCLRSGSARCSAPCCWGEISLRSLREKERPRS